MQTTKIKTLLFLHTTTQLPQLMIKTNVKKDNSDHYMS